jgi:hypothetical protein
LRSIGASTTYTVAAGSPTGFLVLGTFTDTIASPPAFTSSIVWGDGKTSAGELVSFSGAYHVVASHTYAQAGTYVPIVTVKSGGVSLTMKNTKFIVTAAAAASPAVLAATSGTTIAIVPPAAAPAPSSTSAAPALVLGSSPFAFQSPTATSTRPRRAHNAKTNAPSGHVQLIELQKRRPAAEQALIHSHAALVHKSKKHVPG